MAEIPSAVDQEVLVRGMSEQVSGCVFCNISKIARPIRHRGCVMIFEPLNPVVAGHLLVVPERHAEDFADDPGLAGFVMKVAAEEAARIGGDFNLITSKGAGATQSVMHLHVHLIPRCEGDGLHLPWTPSTPTRIGE